MRIPPVGQVVSVVVLVIVFNELDVTSIVAVEVGEVTVTVVAPVGLYTTATVLSIYVNTSDK
jgi:hypothetical protein